MQKSSAPSAEAMRSDLVRVASGRSLDMEVDAVHRASLDQPAEPQCDPAPWFVLIGGEAMEFNGDIQHTSVSFVGSAYEKLRAAGVPRERIVVLTNLEEYRRCVAELSEYQLRETDQACQRLLAEGGADHDWAAVNPNTVRRVLLGIGPGKVVPASASAIFFGIYSHGEKHPTVDGIESDDPLKNEWFAHFPHPADDAEMYSYVATSGAKGYGRNHPDHYLYASQLRAILAQLFARQPDRPVLGLLNFCLSGGFLEFMRNQAARALYGASSWPLLLMSSAKATQEALVAGMWSTWWGHVAAALASSSGVPATVASIYQQAEDDYYQENLYELTNLVCQKRTVQHRYQEIFNGLAVRCLRFEYAMCWQVNCAKR